MIVVDFLFGKIISIMSGMSKIESAVCLTGGNESMFFCEYLDDFFDFEFIILYIRISHVFVDVKFLNDKLS